MSTHDNSAPPSNMKEFLRTVPLPHAIWDTDGRLLEVVTNERQRREAMRRYRRSPAPVTQWDAWTGWEPVERQRVRLGVYRGKDRKVTE